MKDLFPSGNRILTSSWLGSIVFRSQQEKKRVRVTKLLIVIK